MALQAQAQLQQIMLKATTFAFERCTSSSSSGALSSKEQMCIRDNVNAYMRARQLLTGQGQNQGH